MVTERLIPAHGGYRRLKTYQLAELIYDATVRFCDRYIDRRSRTRDQMVQAARSGKQNIAEGSCASGTSKSTELRLTSVARASLEELRLDYEDYLRQHRLPEWPREDPRRQELIDRRPKTADDFEAWVAWVRKSSTKSTGRQRPQSPQRPRTPPSTPEAEANGALVLLRVVCPLLDRQMAAQAAAFETEGGFRERLYRVRTGGGREGGRGDRRTNRLQAGGRTPGPFES
ncbi:MAG: four helix bundle suffix domain-containing protein [Planctomycetota bacterium]|jgi:four helix bundle suffix protein